MDNQDQERNKAFHDAEAAEKKAAEAKAETKQEATAAEKPQMTTEEWCEAHPLATTAIAYGIPGAIGLIAGFVLGRMTK